MKERIRALFGQVKEFYTFAGKKHTTTFAGGLAYFFFTGLVPFISLIGIIAAWSGIDPQAFYSFLANNGIPYPQILAADGAKTGSVVIMIITAAYSSTHFYFHLIRTGENIYSSERTRGMVKRIMSFFYLAIVQLLMISSVFIQVFGGKILDFFGFSRIIVGLVDVLIEIAFNVALAVFLHLFAMPNGSKSLKCVFKGGLFTFAYWEICGLVFSVINGLKGIGDYSFSFVATFLLYLYFLMRGLTYGMAFNAFMLEKGCLLSITGKIVDKTAR